MAKYSFELKLKVVKAYLEGEGGYTYLAKKYLIKDWSNIRLWRNAYLEFGEEGLRRKRKNEKYTVQMKLDAIELYLSSEMSVREVAIEFGIKDPPLVAKWIRKYRENGIEGLSGKQGRPVMKKERITPLETEQAKELDMELPPSVIAHIKEIERQNHELQIENAYLKELRRLRNAQLPRRNENISKIIHSLRGSYQLNEILEVLDFPKSTYMYWQKRFERENPDEALEVAIIEICSKHKDYGYRRVREELKKYGYMVNKKKVQRLMKKLGLSVKSFTRKSRKYNSYKGTVGTVCDNLLKRRFKTPVVHQKVTTDTTEFKYYETDEKGVIHQKKAFLNPFIDLYNLEILSYRVSKSPSYEAIKAALKEAIIKTSDCEYRRTFHSDQGWSYQMKSYVKMLKDNKIFQSMSRKSNCLDNSPIENFFGLLKQEIYYGKVYHSFEELESEITQYIDYYNNHRMKERLGYMSPVEYRQYHKGNLAA